VIQGFFI